MPANRTKILFVTSPVSTNLFVEFEQKFPSKLLARQRFMIVSVVVEETKSFGESRYVGDCSAFYVKKMNYRRNSRS